MIKTTRQKIYDFNKPTAVYCQIAVSVLAEIYRPDFKFRGIKLKIKSVEAIIENRVSYPHQLLSSKQIKGFVFTTERGRFEIQLVDEYGKHPYIHSLSYLDALLRLNVKVENFVVKDIEKIKSDVGFKEIYLATLLNKTTSPELNGGIMPCIVASRGNDMFKEIKVISLK